MIIKKILCFLGFHSYRLKRRIFNNKQECVQTIYICRRCNKINENGIKNENRPDWLAKEVDDEL